MTIEQLRNTYQAKPFQPFVLHLADGRSFQIPHRDFIAHSPQGRTVIVFGKEDNFDMIDLLLVTSIEVTPSDSSGQNGTSI
ncbi:MAG: hypothetical protein MI725_17980 [Pirellulales bacterium]|nr:hypothetical protein [Pirellulales bacterium]